MSPLLALLATAVAADLPVGPAQPYTTVGDAVLAAYSGDRILIEPGTYPEAGFNVDGIALSFEATGGPGTVLIEHQGFGTWMDLDNGADVTWTGIDFDGLFAGRFATLRGGSVLSFSDSSVTQGATFSDGGAIRVLEGSTATISGSTFTGSAANRGGALFEQDSSLTVTGCSFSGNSATADGTVTCDGGTACIVQGSSFQANSSGSGAALWVRGATDARLEQSSVCGTSGDRLVYLDSTTAQITGSILYDNTGLTDALIYVEMGATATLLNNHLVGASSSAAGHAIEVRGSATLTNNLVAFNTGNGPAVRVQGPGVLTAEYNLFFQNATAHADVGLSATNLVDVDPILGVLVPGNCDFSPLEPGPASPAADGGDPSLTGPDGSRSDIGAFVDLVPVDDDGDGFPVGVDCNDTDPAVFPGAAEVLCDGADNDCDPASPDDVNLDYDSMSQCEGDCDDTNPNAQEWLQVYVDKDYDGYGRGDTPTELCGLPNNGALVNGDCDDNDPEIYPGAPEPVGTGIDNNCDGEIVEDGDGDGVPYARDCNDRNPNQYPGNKEIPEDGKDQDCDGIDAELVYTGGAGLSCGGCSSPAGTGTGLSWVGCMLLVAVRRRKDP